MFEGLFRFLLLWYLGRYIKSIEKKDISVLFWKGEILLENVELNLEVFDYLQLPVALKRGHVGRLRIEVPWKVLFFFEAIIGIVRRWLKWLAHGVLGAGGTEDFRGCNQFSGVVLDEAGEVPNLLSASVSSSYSTMAYCFSIAANCELLELEVDLGNESHETDDSSSVFLLSLQHLQSRITHTQVQDYWVSMRAVEITGLMDNHNTNIVCSSWNPQARRSEDGGNGERNELLDGCLLFHYAVDQSILHHTCSLSLNDIKFHCYPNIVRLLVGFCDKLMVYADSDVGGNFIPQKESKQTHFPTFNFQRFGISNFCDNGLIKWASIPLDQFPFVAIRNFGRLWKLDTSIIIPELTNFKVKDKNTRDINKNLKTPLVKVPEAGDYINSSLDMQFDIANVSIDFHDKSSVLGSISLPVGKASVISRSDQFDVLVSVEGLTLVSDWFTWNHQKFLWGPALTYCNPVLNIRVRKGITYLTNSDLEISFGIQHVCCVIPPEFLAILIGYFSLPDWRSNGSNHQCEEISKNICSGDYGSIVYKFEILDSIIMSPIESNEKQFLKLDLQQLYCSFIDNDTLEKETVAILSELSIPEDIIAYRAHSLNIFGRDLHLSLLILKDSDSDASISDKKTGPYSCTLVQSFSVDFWLRLSGESLSSTTDSPVCILTKITNCEFAAEDSNFLSGFMVLAEVIDQYALADKKAIYFNSDIPGFRQSAKSFEDSSYGSAKDFCMSVTKIRCCVSSLSINLITLKGDSNTRDVIGRIEMGFVLSATMKNNVILSSCIHFSTLLLSSSLSSINLGKYLLDSTCASVNVSFSAIQENEIELLIDIPSLKIWLHLSEWAMVIDHVYSCILTLESDELAHNDIAIVVNSRNIVLSCHIPLGASEEGFNQSKSSDAMSKGKYCKFLTVAMQSRELHVHGPNLKFRTNLENITGSFGICESGSIQLCPPFFQLSQLGTEIQISEYEKVPMGVNVKVNCENFDVQLSQQALYFLHDIEFGVAEANYSEITYGIIDLKIQLKKASLLLTDGKRSLPLIELLMRNLHINTVLAESNTKFFTEGELLVNYNNIYKLSWEPFLESWSFLVKMILVKNFLIDGGIITDIQLESSTQLQQQSCSLVSERMGSESTTQLNINFTKSFCEVVLRVNEIFNEVRSLGQICEAPMSQTFQNLHFVENLCVRRYASYTIRNMTSLPFEFHVFEVPGKTEIVDVSTSIYKDIVQPGYSRSFSFDGKLSKKPSNKAKHYFMTIHFDGAFEGSELISMDLVDRTYFEVNFSDGNKRGEANILVPVVFDVSLQHYSKLIQLYSTVIFKNSTSVPLELQFDIPFGMFSKIVGPIYTGEEFPLPLCLVGGHMKWRPVGNNYMWSDVHNLSTSPSTETRIGILRSLACNPSHSSGYLFRCCQSVKDISLSLSGRLERSSPCFYGSVKKSVTSCDVLHSCKRSTTRFIHQVTLISPLVIKNYLPHLISAAIEGGGATYMAVLREVETSFFHVNFSHELAVTFNIQGYVPVAVTFPSAETFSAVAKLSGNVLSLSEVLTFSPESPDLFNGSICVTVEKIMDSLSGAREICISVPFLLYNCTKFALTVSRSDHKLIRNYCIVPSCYDSTEQVSNVPNNEHPKVIPVMYSPDPSALGSNIMVRMSEYHAECPIENLPSLSWSSSFPLVPLSGSTAVFVPQLSTNSAVVVSVTSNLLSMPLMGRTTAIAFQPRYVISNACSKPLYYKQKGTESVYPLKDPLGIGEHSHLHWTYTTIRDLFLSVSFDKEKWSGSFKPDHLGDTQVVIRNADYCALRVEVQNADAIQDTEIVGNTTCKSGTYFILLSDDDSGIVPYRIDNFSNETLQIYQQMRETQGEKITVYPHTSCPYAWDEPFDFHELIVVIREKCTLGSYKLDDAVEFPPVDLALFSTSTEKYDGTLLLSVRAEGAMKVLSIIDSSYVVEEGKYSNSKLLKEKIQSKEGMEGFFDYKEKVSLKISSIGFSLIDSSPQELVYVSAKEIKVELLQNMERQCFSFQISSLQIDNQLHDTPYPVVLFFVEDNIDKRTETKTESTIANTFGNLGISSEPKISLEASIWRNKDMVLVSFEYIGLRIGKLCVELDLELLFKLLEFFKAIPLLKFDTPTLVSGNNSLCNSFAPLNSEYLRLDEDHQFAKTVYSSSDCHSCTSLLPEVVPIGASWQKISLLAGRQNKIFVKKFLLFPVNMALSFSGNPWMLKAERTSGESVIFRSIMALFDVERAQICFEKLTITDQVASLESFQEILHMHYSKQVLHEMYKVFGSAGIIGNPMGFARRVGLGVKDFFSVLEKGFLQNPSGLMSEMSQGTRSLLINILYASSDAATQLSKSANKVLSFAFDNHDASKMKQRTAASSQNKSVIQAWCEAATDALQLPIQGAEKHGLLGILPGIAKGAVGLVAKPAASMLESTGRIAQSVRDQSRIHVTGVQRVRPPRYLSAELDLGPYNEVETIGTAALLKIDEGSNFRDVVLCKPLKDAGSCVVLTDKRFVIILGKSDVGALENVIDATVNSRVVHITLAGGYHKFPLYHKSLEFSSNEEAEHFQSVLLTTIKQGREHSWGNKHVFHQSNLRK